MKPWTFIIISDSDIILKCGSSTMSWVINTINNHTLFFHRAFCHTFLRMCNYPTHGTRAAFEDYVGIGNDDKGPWLHGVTPDGIVYSYYKNPKYWHGSSARGSAGLDRSELVPKDVMSYASIQTIWLDGNHAYWRVDENKQ